MSYPAKGRRRWNLSISGISCLDWSSMGKRSGTFGQGALAWLALMWEFYNRIYDLAICECTYLYQHRHIQIIVSRVGGVVSPVIFSPTDIGYPAERKRKYMIVTFPGLRWITGRTFTKANLLNTFARQVIKTGDVYLENTSRVEIRSYIEGLAKKRRMALRDGLGNRWPMATVLQRGARDRLDKVLAHAHTMKKISGANELYLTINQNPGWASIMVNKVPTLLQATACWSTKAERLLLPKEVCAVMGIPWTALMASMPEKNVRSMAGNAMHAGAIACVILYALANTDEAEFA